MDPLVLHHLGQVLPGLQGQLQLPQQHLPARQGHHHAAVGGPVPLQEGLHPAAAAVGRHGLEAVDGLGVHPAHPLPVGGEQAEVEGVGAEGHSQGELLEDCAGAQEVHGSPFEGRLEVPRAAGAEEEAGAPEEGAEKPRTRGEGQYWSYQTSRWCPSRARASLRAAAAEEEGAGEGAEKPRTRGEGQYWSYQTNR